MAGKFENSSGRRNIADVRDRFQKEDETTFDMDTKVKPPVGTVEELMNLLMSLGIIQKNTDERINMPEIYLHGFGLRRRGGLRRPK